MMADAPHLTPILTERGFQHLPPIDGDYGGTARVYESSNAKGPCLWLAVAPPDYDHRGQVLPEAILHLTVESAGQLADQIRWLIDHHYQTRED